MYRQLAFKYINEYLAFNLSQKLRTAGQKLAVMGTKMQGRTANTDELVISMRNFRQANVTPSNDAAAFIAPNATILGDSRLGHRSSVFQGAQLRGDVCPIRIGDKCFIGDNAKIGLVNWTKACRRTETEVEADLSVSDLTSSDLTSGSDKSDQTDSDSEAGAHRRPRAGVVLMDNVSVGANATIEEDVVVGNNCIIGANAILRSGTVLEPYSVVGAGAVVAEGTTIQSDQVWIGSPAYFSRSLSPEERSNHSENVNENVDLGLCHAQESEKTQHEQIGDQEFREIDTTLKDINMQVQQLTQLRDLTRVKAHSSVLPMVQQGMRDDDYSNVLPDDFVTQNQMAKDSFAHPIGLDDDKHQMPDQNQAQNFKAQDQAKAAFENEDWSQIKAKTGPALHPQDLSSVINWGDDVWEKKWYDMNKYSIKSSGHPSGHGGW